MCSSDLINGYFDTAKEMEKSLLNASSKYAFNDDKKVILHQGKEYRLEKRNYLVAKYLYDNRHKVVSREEINNYIWGDIIIDTRGLDVYIRKIRKAVPGIPIQTRKGFGHIWNE